MPYPADMVRNMDRKYGEDAPRILAQYREAHPDRFKKALRTARRKGHGGIAMHSRYTKRKRTRKSSRRTSRR